MKVGAVVRILVWGLVAAVLCAVMAGGILYDNLVFPQFSLGFNGYHFSDPGSYSVGNTTLDADDIHSIDLDWMAGSICIATTDGDHIIVRESETASSNHALRWRVRNGELQIRYCKPHIGGLGSIYKDLEILIPASMLGTDDHLKSLNIENVSSRIELRDLSAWDVEIESVSGNITLTNTNIETLDLENVSGTVQLSHCTVDRMLVSTVSGSLNVQGTLHRIELDGVSARLNITSDVCPREVSCKTLSGVLELTIPEQSGFVLSMESLSGNLYAPSFTLTSHGDGKYICGNGESRFEFESLSGRVEIQKIIPAGD